jgi:hypothetical protein
MLKYTAQQESNLTYSDFFLIVLQVPQGINLTGAEVDLISSSNSLSTKNKLLNCLIELPKCRLIG